MYSVRPAASHDAHHAMHLLTQLGYPESPDAFQNKFDAFINNPSAHVLIAWNVTTPVGLIAFTCLPSLLTHPQRVVVDSLVVDERHRGAGVGTLLLQAMDASLVKPCVVELSSSARRVQAHAFYTSRGYTSPNRVFFTKLLS